MNYENYTSDKALGRVELVQAGGGFAIARKRWDGLTGEQIDPDITAVNVENVEQMKEELLARVAGLDELLADIAAITK